ncbi:glycolate oxidase subunit GlcF [Fluviibacter phosphoraccumulans]|uniref:glycolate oxidase subunit GlcF n=1 Tax=Fluviibacter phosphoraccumulans TaxID=1751046 RepID=UPI0024E1A251|nr:glycolate oxidase subunit GlcF [Fluviibacter phosphoraccumulans]
MQINITPEFRDDADVGAVKAIVNKCVHCGFCTATCPTYQVLGDELDGPRGRIYLMKQMVEGAPVTAKTQSHLDRCLTCRNCETTCPSGVRYGRLVDIGRRYVDERVVRPLSQRIERWLMRETLSRRQIFSFLHGVGRMLRPLLPATLKKKIQVAPAAGSWPAATHKTKMLLHVGCVQPALMPNVDAATARVFDKLGIELVIASDAECCGAIRQHLSDHHGAEAQMKRNIDAWWPHVENGVETIVINASGCGVMIKDYAEILAHDPAYAAKAERIAKMAKDVSEILPSYQAHLSMMATTKHAGGIPERVTYHPPCTLQHGQKIRGPVEGLLGALGVTVRLCQDSHLCCGSAGTYSMLQPALSQDLLGRKLTNLLKTEPQEIVSGNVGCINHLQSGTDVPVRHWIELIDRMI